MEIIESNKFSWWKNILKEIINLEIDFTPLLDTFFHFKELNLISNEKITTNFFSVNTGGGFVFELTEKWHPAIEFNYAWGKINQQFLLITLAYEMTHKK